VLEEDQGRTFGVGECRANLGQPGPSVFDRARRIAGKHGAAVQGRSCSFLLRSSVIEQKEMLGHQGQSLYAVSARQSDLDQKSWPMRRHFARWTMERVLHDA
jgi:hypothetical protein